MTSSHTISGFYEDRFYGQPHKNNDVDNYPTKFYVFAVQGVEEECYGNVGGFVSQVQFDRLAGLFGTRTLAEAQKTLVTDEEQDRG